MNLGSIAVFAGRPAEAEDALALAISAMRNIGVEEAIAAGRGGV